MGPRAEQTRVILPDIHGNHAALRALLDAVGALDDHGRKHDRFWVAQAGDLIHGGHDVLDADRETLELAQQWIDLALLGNHELPFVTSIESPWSGMHCDHQGWPWHPACQTELNRLFRDGFFTAAAAVDGWLLTHAGVDSEHCFDDHGLRADAPLRRALADGAQAAAEHLNDRFAARLLDRARRRDLVIDGRCPWRGGGDPVGSIFWTDLNPLLQSARRHGNPVAQIVGHTPRIDDEPQIYQVPDEHRDHYEQPPPVGTLVAKLGAQPIWSIDLYGVDDGRIGCLVKAPDDQDWSVVAIDRPTRPHSDPDNLLLADLSQITHWAKDWSVPYGGYDV